MHLILTLSETTIGGIPTPTLSGVDYISHEQGADYIGYGPLIRGVGVAQTRAPLATLHRLAAGSYLVCASSAILAANNKLSLGKTMSQLGRDWPFWKLTGTQPDPEDAKSTVPYREVKRMANKDVPAVAASVAQSWVIGTATITKASPENPTRFRGLSNIAD